MTLQQPKSQQKKLHSRHRRPVHPHIMVTMDRAIIPVITTLASTVHSRIATAMDIINGNSTDRVMGMHIVMHGVVIAAAAITKHYLSIDITVVTFFLLLLFFFSYYREALCKLVSISKTQNSMEHKSILFHAILTLLCQFTFNFSSTTQFSNIFFE